MKDFEKVEQLFGKSLVVKTELRRETTPLVTVVTTGQLFRRDFGKKRFPAKGNYSCRTSFVSRRANDVLSMALILVNLGGFFEVLSIYWCQCINDY